MCKIFDTLFDAILCWPIHASSRCRRKSLISNRIVVWVRTFISVACLSWSLGQQIPSFLPIVPRSFVFDDFFVCVPHHPASPHVLFKTIFSFTTSRLAAILSVWDGLAGEGGSQVERQTGGQIDSWAGEGGRRGATIGQTDWWQGWGGRQLVGATNGQSYRQIAGLGREAVEWSDSWGGDGGSRPGSWGAGSEDRRTDDASSSRSSM